MIKSSFHFLSQVCITQPLTIVFKPCVGIATTYLGSQRFVIIKFKNSIYYLNLNLKKIKVATTYLGSQRFVWHKTLCIEFKNNLKFQFKNNLSTTSGVFNVYNVWHKILCIKFKNNVHSTISGFFNVHHSI